MPVVAPGVVNVGVIHANNPLADVKAISHVLGPSFGPNVSKDLPFFDPNSQSCFTSKETQKNQRTPFWGGIRP